MTEPTYDPYKYRQLFLDDLVIESMDGVTRKLHQPRREAYAIKADQSRNQIAVQASSVPQWKPEKDLWEWWYAGTYEVPEHGPYAAKDRNLTHYATSKDGIDWEFPRVGRYEWQGNTDNGVAIDPDGRPLSHIVRDERDPDPQRRYKAFFDHRDRYPAWSPDGFEWTFADTPPIPSKDTSKLFYDDFNDRWAATVKHGTEWGRSVWLVTSDDFVHWTDPRLVLHTDEIDYIAELYLLPVMPYEGLYVGFPLLFNPAGAIPPPRINFTGLNQTELAVSRDLLSWERVADRALFLEVEPWDGENYATAQVSMCGRPIVRDDEIWVYHSAYRFRSYPDIQTDVDPSYFDDRGALALAKLRLDGFVSLDGDGEVVTKPFKANGGTVHINAVAPSGQVKAEVIDAKTMEPLPGLGLAESSGFTGDDLRAPLVWNGASFAGGGQVRLRFSLKDASLYSFWVD